MLEVTGNEPELLAVAMTQEEEENAREIGDLRQHVAMLNTELFQLKRLARGGLWVYELEQAMISLQGGTCICLLHNEGCCAGVSSALRVICKHILT